MEDVHLHITFGKAIKGYEIIKAMEEVVGTRLVRYSKEYLGKKCFVIGCRGGSNSQAGDAWIEVSGIMVINPEASYDSLSIINHSWIEPLKNQWSGEYFKTPTRSAVIKALTDLQSKLKKVLKVK